MHPLDGSFLKLNRAKYHFKVVDDLVKEIKERKPYYIEHEVVRNRQTREFILRFKQNEELDTNVSLLIGDICNNLRSALDYLIWQLWLLNKHSFNGIVYFPICDNESSYKTSRTRDNIKGLSDLQRAAIESIQPYKTGNSALSLLRDVNNSDKHRLIQVIAFYGSIRNLRVTITQPDGLIVPFQHISPQIAKGTKIENGTEIARVPWGVYPKGSHVRVQSRTVLDYVFEGSKTANGKSIKPSIDAMVSEVYRVIILFEPEFSKFGVSKFK